MKARVGMAAAALLAGALMPLTTAAADEGSATDEAVDNFYQSIANYFAPEATGNMLTADQFSDLFTGEGTAADQMVDAFYQSVNTAFQPEGPIDMFFDQLFGIPF